MTRTGSVAFLRLSDSEIDSLLDEDLRFGDLTTRALGIGDRRGRMTFAARRDLVLCGIEEAERLFARLGLVSRASATSGATVSAGAVFLEVEGAAAALHAGWKVSQTLMEWASGIATETRAIVDAARAVSPNIGVFCTRKSVPFTRQLSLKAVLAGGGEIHRLGLSDTIMLFPEHRAFIDGSRGIEDGIKDLRARVPERAIMVEVTSEAEAFAAAAAMADVIQLEKFPIEGIVRVVARIEKRADGRPIVAAAGGVTAQNAAVYAGTGIDALVTSAPFQARPMDIKVSMSP